MKIIKLFFLLLFISSCQINTDVDTENVLGDLTYFKDPETGLCFAAVGSVSTKSLSSTVAITCVPCDSLKNVKVK